MLHILVLLLLSSSNHSTYAIEHVQNCSSKDGCEVELKINVLLDLDNESTRITYQMCHNNTNPIELNSQSTYMSYEGQKIPNPFLHLNLTKCRTFTVTHKNETPQIRAASERTVSIQLDGSVTGKRCYCNLSKNITQIDVGASCGSTDSFLITEIVDPRHHPEDRFIEIFSAECKNKIIREDVKIEHTHNQEFSVSDVRVSLQNLRFDDNGFIVLCRTQNADLAYNVNCTMFRESFFSSEHVGTASYRIARYDNEGNDTVIDMYGEGIEVTNVNAHDFTEGRAVRKLCATAPSEEWNQQHWIIKAGANIEDSDPFRWGIQSPINCGPSSEPSSEPSSAPSSAPNISSSPSPDEIDDLIITEVATSYTNYLSFVELYAPSLKGRNIEEVSFTASHPSLRTCCVSSKNPQIFYICANSRIFFCCDRSAILWTGEKDFI